MAVLFLHGAGGFVEDRTMVGALRAGLDDEVLVPNLDEGIATTHEAWSRRVVEHLRADVDVVVGHSFGGSTVLRLLTERDPGIRRLVLLAAPDWGPDGWEVPEFSLPDDADARLPGTLGIELHHCLDDEVVPFEHVQQLGARLPRARVVRHEQGGHQFASPAIDAVVRRL
ncbi:alpha/beta fold hydrolase [Janibacter corallicola]|uniref:alpha/beta fold hydrolase n=1 Tax=Janibacter corallicola TaxID=415212 RepID=UPI000835AAF6|nr:alpha/beta fold hydrolase [Janibacter corallicola]